MAAAFTAGDNYPMNDETAPLAVETSIKERRKALKWSQEKLAQEAGISTTAVHNLEAGKNGFTDKTLASLARALGCRPADLLLPINAETPKIETETDILSFLARIDKLSPTDIDVAFAVIKNALDVKRAGSERSENRDQQPVASRHRVKVPSR